MVAYPFLNTLEYQILNQQFGIQCFPLLQFISNPSSRHNNAYLETLVMHLIFAISASDSFFFLYLVAQIRTIFSPARSLMPSPLPANPPWRLALAPSDPGLAPVQSHLLTPRLPLLLPPSTAVSENFEAYFGSHLALAPLYNTTKASLPATV